MQAVQRLSTLNLKFMVTFHCTTFMWRKLSRNAIPKTALPYTRGTTKLSYWRQCENAIFIFKNGNDLYLLTFSGQKMIAKLGFMTYEKQSVLYR